VKRIEKLLAVYAAVVLLAVCSATSVYAYSVDNSDTVSGVPVQGGVYIECTASGLGGATVVLLPTLTVARELSISSMDVLGSSRAAFNTSTTGGTQVGNRMLAYRPATGTYVIVGYVTAHSAGSGNSTVNVNSYFSIMGNGTTGNSTGTPVQALGTLVVQRTNLPLYNDGVQYKVRTRGYEGFTVVWQVIMLVAMLFILFRRR